jgi:glucose-6-phosphate isomerase
MSRLKSSASWRALEAHQQEVARFHLRDLFAQDPGRADRYKVEAAGIRLDYSKNLIVDKTLELLQRLAAEGDVAGSRDRMFAGEKINWTEDRAAHHVALRHPAEVAFPTVGENPMRGVREQLAAMARFAAEVRSGARTGFAGGRFTDVVHIGIGGSDLGPAMVAEALQPMVTPNLRFHFVSNVDGTHLAQTLKPLRPETTLFIVVSKTFTTQETLTNAKSALAWLKQANPQLAEAQTERHFVAVTADSGAVAGSGVPFGHKFLFWEWVGGRYSLWSSVGLPLVLALGMDGFQELLAGAHAMDTHFREAPFKENLPVILALLGIWYLNFWGAQSYAILPYDQNLRRLPAYLQQAEMESNGKRLTRDDELVDYDTAPVIWGEPGTNGQHSFYQLLHQGTRLVPADFIIPIRTQNPLGDHHRILLSHAIAQTEALMKGQTLEEARACLRRKGVEAAAVDRCAPHLVCPGNRPTNMLVVSEVDPRTLGALIALYEHKIFVQGVIWRINSFDQWGVELGKQLAGTILGELAPGAAISVHDTSTQSLIERCQKRAGA